MLENFRGTSEGAAKADAVDRISSYLANSGDVKIENGSWDYRVLIQEQHSRLRLEDSPIEWPWTFRVTILPGLQWDVRYRTAGDAVPTAA